MTPPPSDKAAPRAEYLASAGELLEALDILADAETRVRKAVDAYGDPLSLIPSLEAAAPALRQLRPAEPSAAPDFGDGRGEGPRKTYTRTSYVTAPIREIVLALIRDNPGRTTSQLKAAVSSLPEDRRFHAPSLTPSLTDLVRKGEVDRGLCDTERHFKYYVKGAVPPGVFRCDPTHDIVTARDAFRSERARLQEAAAKTLRRPEDPKPSAILKAV